MNAPHTQLPTDWNRQARNRTERLARAASALGSRLQGKQVQASWQAHGVNPLRRNRCSAFYLGRDCAAADPICQDDIASVAPGRQRFWR